VKANRASTWHRRSLAVPAAVLLGTAAVTAARADMVLLSDTTLVTGQRASVYSFNTPAAGTVTVQLTNLAWPQALSNLSFMATTPTQVLSSWSAPSSPPGPTTETMTFQVTGSGAYYADVMATAGGPLHLGLYSLSLSFAPPGSPVPLPSSGGLLVGALVVLFGLLWRRRPVDVAQPLGVRSAR
jgi:hypothetical protein